MKAVIWTVSIAAALTTTLAFATGTKDIAKEIGETQQEIQAACGCGVEFSYSRDLDFTQKNGSSLALNVKNAIEDTGTVAKQWCKKGEEFAAKFCLMVNAVEIDEDPSTKRPYTRTVSRGVVRSYLATKNMNQISNPGGSWVTKFLETGRMPERKPEE